MLTLREIISDGPFELDSRTLLRKTCFFFGDAIIEEDRILCDRDYKLLHQIGDRKFFSSQHGEDVPLGIFVAHVGTLRNGVGPF